MGSHAYSPGSSSTSTLVPPAPLGGSLTYASVKSTGRGQGSPGPGEEESAPEASVGSSIFPDRVLQ